MGKRNWSRHEARRAKSKCAAASEAFRMQHQTGFKVEPFIISPALSLDVHFVPSVCVLTLSLSFDRLRFEDSVFLLFPADLQTHTHTFRCRPWWHFVVLILLLCRLMQIKNTWVRADWMRASMWLSYQFRLFLVCLSMIIHSSTSTYDQKLLIITPAQKDDLLDQYVIWCLWHTV